MKAHIVGAAITGALAVGVLVGVAIADSKKEAVHVDSTKAMYKDLAPGAMGSVLWGEMDKGPYGAFTKFTPGAKFGLHTHTNDLRVVVTKGAYIYRPEKGVERRVGVGEYLFIPGGDKHASGADAKDGVIFYQESTGKFDLNMVK